MAAHSDPRHTRDSAVSWPGFGARWIATLVGLLAGLVVVPAALWAWRHNPLPTQLEPGRWVRLALDGYIHPDVVPDLLAAAGWLVWGQFVFALCREMAAQLRRGAGASRSALVLPPIQRLACHLAAAISVLVAAGVRPEPAQPLATLAHATLAAAAPPVPGQAANVASPASAKQDPECVTFADPDPGDPVLAGHLHVCGPYDTLRSLAGREYGDPARWTLIRDASVGLRQTDGTRLRPGFVAVADGTRLHIPRSSPTAETASHPPAARDGVFVPSAGEYTVRPGDCLWDIAETHYPQAEVSDIPGIVRAIFSANRGVSDGQGHRLRDPDLINPGMVLRLPTATSGKASKRPRVDSAPHQFPPASPPGSPTASPKASPAPAPSASATADRSAAAAPTSPATRDHAWDTPGEPPADEPTVPAALPMWVAGASLLASGFAAVWAYRRRRRDGKVRPGQSVPPPDPSLVPLHTAMRVAADSDWPTRLDAALRSLAGLHVRAGPGAAPVVQVLLRQPEGDLEVFLREGRPTLPAPWQPTSDPRIWRLPGHEDVVLDGPTRAMPHPNPAIVQLGTTHDGAEFYIDLEAIGVLAIGTDDDTDTQSDAGAQAGIASPDEVPVSLRGIARAVTVTLATSPLADIPRIRTIGFDPFGLADEERIHAESSVDELVEHATNDVDVIRRQINDCNLDSTLTLRVCRPGETWDPTIAVVADRHLTPEHAERLMALAGSGSQGLAVILPADAAPSAIWRLVLLHTQRPVQSSRRARWRLDPLGVVLAPISLAADELEDLAALLDEADTPAVTLAPDEPLRGVDVSDHASDLSDGQTTGPAGENRQAAIATDAISPAISTFTEPAWQVMVRLLGPVDVIGRDGAKPIGVRERTLETLAWLVLHRRNVTRTDLEAALWPTGARAGTVSNTLSRARAALEEIAGPEAHAWIPGHQAGLGIDRLVTSDLEQLQARLAYARHRDHPQTAIPVLRDGLALVRGVPAGYAWLDAQLGSTLTITPTTAAILLAELYLEQEDLDGVLEATETGLAVLPAHPELFALRMKARAATGDRRAVRAEYEAYLRAESADPMADGETDRDLERLYLDLIRTSAR